MSDIFISYKREEQPTAKKLAVALERYGWSVWWDPHLRAGEHFDDAIEEALRDAKCVIVLWSKQSVNSQYVRDEATYALNREKLVPVAIEGVDPPFRFAGLHTAQLRDWDGSDEFPGFIKLVDDIRINIGSQSTVVLEGKRTLGTEGNSGSREGARKVDAEPQPKAITAKQKTGRSKIEWLLNVVVTAALGLFYFAAVASACSNDDILVLSVLVGYPLSIFLIFQKRPYSIAWILAPLASFFIGLPYGHNYGTITKSPLFGLEQGGKCQSGPEVLVILGIVAVAAVIDHALFLHNSKRR